MKLKAWGVVAMCALAMLQLGGCASQQKLRKGELEQLMAALPGVYNNGAQARADAAAGVSPPHAVMNLLVTSFFVPVLGEHVLHVRETAVDDPRRLISQQIWTFSVVDGKRIVQRILLLAEPERWRTGDPQLFRSLLPSDTRPLNGCELVWQKTSDGFSAANQRSTCRANSRVDDEVVTVEYRAELKGDELAISERHFDAAGRVVAGNEADPYYRFVRRTR